MKEYKDYWTIDKLKDEINLRYNFMRYKKMHKQLLLNIIEKNNVHMLCNTIEDLFAEE